MSHCQYDHLWACNWHSFWRKRLNNAGCTKLNSDYMSSGFSMNDCWWAWVRSLQLVRTEINLENSTSQNLTMQSWFAQNLDKKKSGKWWYSQMQHLGRFVAHPFFFFARRPHVTKFGPHTGNWTGPTHSSKRKDWLKWRNWWTTLLETNISPNKALLEMIFLFPRWDMLVPWRVTGFLCIPELSAGPFAFDGCKFRKHILSGSCLTVKTCVRDDGHNELQRISNWANKQKKQVQIKS